MSRSRRTVALVAAFLLAAVTLLAVPAAGTEAPTSPAGRYFTDLELVDQNGTSHRLYSDLLAGKVVVVSAFFARCEGVCPALNAKLAQVQKWLGDRLGREVRMLSITVDAEHDTPEVLAEYARQWKARPGWYFLTGDPRVVDQALYKMGQYVEQKEAHTSIVIFGNEPTGLWKKANGLATPEDLVAILASVLEDQGAAPGGG